MANGLKSGCLLSDEQTTFEVLEETMDAVHAQSIYAP